MKAVSVEAPPRDDFKPIVLGAFTLHEKGVDVEGRPSWANFVGAWEFAKRAHQASGFWLADLLRVGEMRAEWADRLSQAVDSTGLTRKRLENIRAVAAIPKSRRREKVEFALHEEVAGLEPDQQEKLLARAETENWDRRDMRHAIKRARRLKVLDGQADTWHTIEVSVQLDLEAQTPYEAEQAAWAQVKQAVQGIKTAKVVASHARPK